MLFVASASTPLAVMPTVVPIDRVLGHLVGRSVGVADRADIEFVDVVDADREDLIGERSVG